SRGRAQERREDPHHGRLAGAVRAEQAERLTFADRERDAAHGLDAARKRLPQLLALEDRHSTAATSDGGSSSARRRCTTARESTPTSRPSSTTGTRSRSCSSSAWNASSSGVSASSVKFGGSKIARSSVSRGCSPAATTSRTSVLRVTTP